MSDPESLVANAPGDAAPAPTRARYAVLGFTLLLAAVAYLDRVCISTSAPAIQSDLHLSDTQLGWVFGAFTFAYGLFEVPSGWLADRFGARLMLTRIVLWWSLMTAATGWVGGFASLFAVRLLFGMGRDMITFSKLSKVEQFESHLSSRLDLIRGIIKKTKAK